MKNILITGSAGFIGAHLYKRLKSKGYNVIGLDNLSHPSANTVTSKYCDVRYFREILSYFANCDVVYHLAAQINIDKSIECPEETIATNIIGTQNVLEAARRFSVKVVFASTSEIYGSSQSEYMGENHPIDCQSPYGASKLAADRLCYSYYKTFGMNVCIVRNFNTFGPYQSFDSYGGVIAKFALAAVQGEPLTIYGDGTQRRDYMYIDDALQAYELMSEMPSGSVVNFGSGVTVSVNEIATLIKEFTGSNSEIIHIAPRKGEVQRLCADITRAKSLGFKPITDFKENLKEYIKWFLNEVSLSSSYQ